MGGMRAAGDLVARMQMTRGMKIDEAKAYVADKLSISVSDLTDPVIMTEIRQDLEIGIHQSAARLCQRTRGQDPHCRGPGY